MSAPTAEAKTAEGPFEKFGRDAVDLALKLGLPRGFLLELVEEDDWSLCVKGHAVVEAALEKAIFAACFNQYGRPVDKKKLRKMCSDLPVDGRVSKIAMAEAFDLFGPATARHIRALSRLRNGFVHDVSRIGLSIREAIAVMGPDIPSDFLATAIRVSGPGLTAPQMDDRAIRFLMVIGLVYTLWEIDFRSQPPPSLISPVWPPSAAAEG